MYLHYLVKLETWKLFFSLNNCCALLTNTQSTSTWSPGYRQTILRSLNDQLYATNMTKTGHKASSHLICTQSAFAMSAMISGAMSVVWGSFSPNIERQRTLSVRYFTTLSQPMLTAVKHVADDNCVFCRTAHWHVVHATPSNSRCANSQLHFFQYYGLQLNSEANWLWNVEIHTLAWVEVEVLTSLVKSATALKWKERFCVFLFHKV